MAVETTAAHIVTVVALRYGEKKPFGIDAEQKPRLSTWRLKDEVLTLFQEV